MAGNSCFGGVGGVPWLDEKLQTLWREDDAIEVIQSRESVCEVEPDEPRGGGGESPRQLGALSHRIYGTAGRAGCARFHSPVRFRDGRARGGRARKVALKHQC